MPSDGRRLHPFTVVSRALRLARQLLLPAVLGGASAGDGLAGALLWIFGLLSLPSLGAAFAQWLAFRYRLDDDELSIDSGVFSRRRRVIPLARIQNIDLEQGFLDRLVGVAALRMETASGGRETEAALEVLSLGTARKLQAELGRRRATAQNGGASDGVGSTASAGVGSSGSAGVHPIAPPPRRTLLRLSTTELVLAGATSNEAGLIAAAAATGLEVVDDLGSLDRLGGWVASTLPRWAEAGVVGAAGVFLVLALAFAILGWLVSIVAHVVRYHGFTLSREGDDLRREYGLFSRHHSTVPLERVQAVRLEESLLRRPLGLAALKIETAGAGPGQRRRGAGQGAEAYVPIARRADIPALIQQVFPDAEVDGEPFRPVAPVSRRRGFVRLALPLLAAMAGSALLLDVRWAALGLLLWPAWLFARAQYRARGWARVPGYTLARSGVLTLVTWVVPERKIQTLHVRASPFQRRVDVATLLIDTAAGGRAAHVSDLATHTASHLLRDLAADAEIARRASLSSSPGG
jgi:putative membrane protein